ncbi:MAG: LPS-assembly protein [Cellvibrionaceae bacterium]|jgi:LPS-assembly protein
MIYGLRYWLLWLSAIGTCCSPLVYADQTSSDQVTTYQATRILDWVPLEALTEAQKEALPFGSCGAYIAPVRTDNDANLPPNSAPIRASANTSTLYEMPNESSNNNQNKTADKHVILIGDVIITQGYRQLKAQRAEIDQANSTLILEGELEIREPGLLVLGDKATIVQTASFISTDVSTQSAANIQPQGTIEVNQAQYVLHQQKIRGGAKTIKKTASNTINLSSASFTQCEPGNDTWLLKGSQIILDTDARQGHAKHVRLLVKGVPVFYFPYLRFPLGDARLSGFLAPTFAYSNDNVTISAPYYLNLAPNYDLLFTTHWREANGLLYEGQFRHLNPYLETELNLGFLNGDKGKIDKDDQDLIDDGTITEEDVVPFKNEDRWVVNLNQSGGANQAWSTRIDYTEVSDIDYFDDFDNNTASERDENHLNQRILTGYTTENWQFGLDATRYQLLSESITAPFQQLPAITANGLYSFNERRDSNWSLALNNEWIAFDHANADASNPILTGQRLRADYSLGFNFEPEWGFLRPAFQTKHLQYWLDDHNFVDSADESPSITVPQVVIDSGLFFERDGSLLGNGYLQTFEPHLLYFYSDFEDHSPLFDLTTDNQDIDFDTSELTFSFSQLFRDTRFSGGDRIDDANQLAIGLSTRFFGNDSGREWFSASVGQITYFDDRRVTLTNAAQTDNNSAIAAQLSANPTVDWRISSNLLYDDSLNQVDRGNLSLRYQSERKNLFNVSYRYIRGATDTSTVEQLDAGIIAPIFSPRWHLLLYSAYDTVRNRELDSVSAIEYSGCCYRVRVGYRSELDSDLVDTLADDELDYDYSAFFELQFKGLGGTGKQLDTLLDESIDGYLEWRAVYGD